MCSFFFLIKLFAHLVKLVNTSDSKSEAPKWADRFKSDSEYSFNPTSFIGIFGFLQAMQALQALPLFILLAFVAVKAVSGTFLRYLYWFEKSFVLVYCGYSEIGKHDRFRPYGFEPCGFESCYVRPDLKKPGRFLGSKKQGGMRPLDPFYIQTNIGSWETRRLIKP